MDLAAVFVVPTALFLLFVAPTWLFLHYRSKRRAEAALSDDERAELERLTVAAGQMSERIETLESILDERTPDWRNRIAAGP
ncbi:MAG: envelope stress response membrane protein PspB [Gammaproteobacteria bacterium]|nr:envelope stress response membrane protein PspB [Gammaproteobacteria bacterium]MXY52406.1 envelope stress response membrane protein PspB [Gammaproteobacteria bacterium]MYB39418.1 envelope stress response membrane protein PspB [Gammaproteobacteria bacterium]